MKKLVLLAPLTLGLLAPPALASPLPLDSLLNEALSGHPTVESARDSADAQASRAQAARSPYWPQLSFSTSSSVTTNVSQAQLAAQPFNISSAGLALRQQLYDFGKTAAEVQAAEASARATTYTVTQQSVEVAYQVRRAYLDWLQALGLEAQAAEREKSASRLFDQAQAFYKAGRRARIDVTRADANLQQARAGAISARNATRVAVQALTAAVGRTQPLAGEPTFPRVPGLASKPLSELQQLAVRQHPSLLATSARLESAQATQLRAERARWPDLNADLSYGLRTRDFVPGQNWNTGVSLSVPLFDGFAISRQADAAASQTGAAQADVRARALQVNVDVERAYWTMAGNRDRLPAMEAAANSARENLALAEGRYRSGVGSIIELSDAQLLATTAQSDLVRARADYHLAVADLLRAVGQTGLES